MKRNLKVVIITQDEPFYIPKYLNLIIKKISEGIEVISIIALPPNITGKSYLQSIFYFLNFYGFLVFFYMVILRIYYFITDALKSLLSLEENIHSVRKIADLNKIDFLYSENINSKDNFEYIKKLEPDIVFSLACPQRLEKEIISIPDLFTINIHSSLLPEFRGINANFWVLAKGKEKTGVSIHLVDKDFDNGKILMQKILNIDNKWSMNDLYHKIMNIGSDSIAELLNKIKNGVDIDTKENDLREGSYFSYPSKEDVREFRNRKKRFFKFL